MSYRPGSSEKWRRCLLSDGFAAGLLSLVPPSALCSILIGLSFFSHFSGVSFDRSYLGTESSVFSRPVYCHNALSRFVVISRALVIVSFPFLMWCTCAFVGIQTHPGCTDRQNQNYFGTARKDSAFAASHADTRGHVTKFWGNWGDVLFSS